MTERNCTYLVTKTDVSPYQTQSRNWTGWLARVVAIRLADKNGCSGTPVISVAEHLKSALPVRAPRKYGTSDETAARLESVQND